MTSANSLIWARLMATTPAVRVSSLRNAKRGYIARNRLNVTKVDYPFDNRSDYAQWRRPSATRGVPATGFYTGAEGIKTAAQVADNAASTAGWRAAPTAHASQLRRVRSASRSTSALQPAEGAVQPDSTAFIDPRHVSAERLRQDQEHDEVEDELEHAAGGHAKSSGFRSARTR